MPNIITIPNGTFQDYTTSQLYIPEFLYNNYYYDTGWSQFTNINKTTLSPDDYLKLPTNSDITMAEDDQRIPNTSAGTPIDGEINTQGSFTMEGVEPQAFNEVEQILNGEGQGGSLIGEDDGEKEGNLRVNNLRVKINVKAGRWYFFCFPFDVTIANCEYPGQYVRAMTSATCNPTRPSSCRSLTVWTKSASRPTTARRTARDRRRKAPARHAAVPAASTPTAASSTCSC